MVLYLSGRVFRVHRKGRGFESLKDHGELVKWYNSSFARNSHRFDSVILHNVAYVTKSLYLLDIFQKSMYSR